MGTVIGVLVIPGLYYLFGQIDGGRKLLQDETNEPLSEISNTRRTNVDTYEANEPHDVEQHAEYPSPARLERGALRQEHAPPRRHAVRIRRWRAPSSSWPQSSVELTAVEHHGKEQMRRSTPRAMLCSDPRITSRLSKTHPRFHCSRDTGDSRAGRPHSIRSDLDERRKPAIKLSVSDLRPNGTAGQGVRTDFVTTGSLRSKDRCLRRRRLVNAVAGMPLMRSTTAVRREADRRHFRKDAHVE